MKLSLYEIAEDQRLLNEMLEANGGELTPEIEEAMQITEENMTAKAEAYGATIAEYDAQAEVCASEIKRLMAYKKTCENVSKRMKERLSDAMMAFNTEKLTAGTFRFSFRKSTSVAIDDETLIPEQYFKVERTLSKKELSEALKGGAMIAGARLEQRKTLQMR